MATSSTRSQASQRGWPYEAPELSQFGRVSTRVRRRIPDSLKTPARLALVARARRRLRAQAVQATTIPEWVALAFDFACGPVTILPCQVPNEIKRLLERLSENPPATVLEIGTAWGGTLFLLTRVAAKDAILVSIDLPDGPFGGYDKTRTRLFRSFARESQRVELVRADSHAESTRRHVERVLTGRRLDFLMIDGDHTSEGVRADFSQYADLVAPGGMIAFHDIVPGEADRTGGVPEFWRELRAARATQVEEIVDDWGQGGFGIGIVHV